MQTKKVKLKKIILSGGDTEDTVLPNKGHADSYWNLGTGCRRDGMRQLPLSKGLELDRK